MAPSGYSIHILSLSFHVLAYGLPLPQAFQLAASSGCSSISRSRATWRKKVVDSFTRQDTRECPSAENEPRCIQMKLCVDCLFVKEPIMNPWHRRRERDLFNLWVPIAATCGMILLWFIG